MDAAQKAAVIRLASDVGIPSELFSGWDGSELALYPDLIGTSRSPEIADRIAREKAARADWILDLGNRAVSLRKDQGTQLRLALDEAEIPYATGSQSLAYFKRIHRVSTENDHILRELSKR